jgi:hypothetical protein
MEMIGTVCGADVARVKNGEGFALMLQVRFSDSHDVRTVQYMPQAGEDTVPINGSKVGVVDVGGILLAVSSYDTIKSVRSPGEKEFYSYDGSQKLARFSLKKNGKAYLGNGPTGTNLRGVLQELIEGIQAATYINPAGLPTPLADTSAKISKALSDLILILDTSA